MIEHLFLNLGGDFEAVSQKVFTALGITRPEIGDSVNALGGVYAVYAVFGVAIRLEMNAYDYEDQFDFMISVKRSPFVEFCVDDETVRLLAELIRQLIVENLGVQVGLEVGTALDIVAPET